MICEYYGCLDCSKRQHERQKFDQVRHGQNGHSLEKSSSLEQKPRGDHKIVISFIWPFVWFELLNYAA